MNIRGDKKCRLWGYIVKINVGSNVEGVKIVAIRETSTQEPVPGVTET